MITVRVFRTDGATGIPNKKVSLHDSMGTRSGSTDASGSVHFDCPSGRYRIYVDGRTLHDGPVVGVCVVYL